MSYIEYVPFFIVDTADYKPGHVVTADEFNNWFNLNRRQGNENSEVIQKLVNSNNTHEETLTTHGDYITAHDNKLSTIETGAQVNQVIEADPYIEEGVMIGTVTINGVVKQFYAPVAGEVVQSDWLQTDTSSVDYIKNKPLPAESVVLNLEDFSGTYHIIVALSQFGNPVSMNDRIELYVNGLKLNSVADGFTTLVSDNNIVFTFNEENTFSSEDYAEIIVRR